MAEELKRSWKATDRVWELFVCALCGSDRIVSTEDDSWCEECHEWMNADSVQVGVLPSDPIAHAARDAALRAEEEANRA